MSVRLMTAAWAADVPSTDKIVLLALADWSNDDGHCWPSIPQLIGKCGLSERGVQNAIKRLEGAGHIERRMNVGKGTYYTIAPLISRAEPPHDVHPHPRTTCTPALNAPPHDVHPSTQEKPVKSKTKPHPRTTCTPARRAPNTLQYIKEENATLPDWLPAEPWEEFRAMRKRIRAPMTPYAEKCTITDLDRMRQDGHDVAVVLNNSIKNSWRGVFAPKANEGGQAATQSHSEIIRRKYASQ